MDPWHGFFSSTSIPESNFVIGEKNAHNSFGAINPFKVKVIFGRHCLRFALLFAIDAQYKANAARNASIEVNSLHIVLIYVWLFNLKLTHLKDYILSDQKSGG